MDNWSWVAIPLVFIAFAWCEVEQDRGRVEERRISVCSKVRDDQARAVCIGGRR